MHVSAGEAGAGLGAAPPAGTLHGGAPSTAGGKPAPSPCSGSLVFLAFRVLGLLTTSTLTFRPAHSGRASRLRCGVGIPSFPPPAVALTPATVLLGPCFLAGEAYVAGGETEAWKEAARLLGKAWV